MGEGPNEQERYTSMSMEKAQHQMPAAAGRVTVRDGEAVSKVVSDEACSPRHDTESAGQALLEQALARENMQRAWKRVKANKGAAGVDGMDIVQTGRYLTTAWPAIKQQLMAGTYRPRSGAARRHPQARWQRT